MNENLFLDKLDIIIKRQRLAEENEDDWHYSKKGEKTSPQQQQRHTPNRERPLREKYNFLEDALRKISTIKSLKEPIN
jgi:hypothetical protein